MPTNVSEAYGNHSISKYVTLLHTSDLSNEERIKVMKGLCDTLNYSTQRQLIIETDVIEACVKLLSYTKEDEICYYGLKILALLMKESRAREYLNQNSMLTTINCFLISKSPRLIDQLLDIYMTLSFYPNGIIIIIQHHFIIISLIELVSLAETTLQQNENGFEILKNITNVIEGKRTAIDNDIITPLLNVYSNPMHYSNDTLFSTICICINLVILEYGELTILSTNIVALSINLLSSILLNIYAPPKTTAAAITTTTIISSSSSSVEEFNNLLNKLVDLLDTIGISKTGKYQIIQNNGIQVLIQCLKKENLKNKAIRTLASISDAPESLQIGIPLLLKQPEILAQIYGIHAIHVLNQYLKEETDYSQQKYILQSIQEICCQKDGADAVFQSLYMIENIAAVLEREDNEVKQYAMKCLYIIAHKSKENEDKIRRKLQQLNISEDYISHILFIPII